MKVKEPERVWMELKEDLALGEVAERICSELPPLPPGGAGVTVNKTITITDSISNGYLEMCLNNVYIQGWEA